MDKTSTLVLTNFTKLKNKRHAENHAEIPLLSDSVINSLINYSKSLTIKKSSSVGFIEIVAT